MGFYFNHEKLRVYQEALLFVAWWEEISDCCKGLPTIKDQMDRASTSAPLNIAEGNAKFSARDRCRYFQIAAGSSLECAACLDVLVARNRLSTHDVEPGKMRLRGIVSMLMGLINGASDRVSEEQIEYPTSAGADFDPDETIVGQPS